MQNVNAKIIQGRYACVCMMFAPRISSCEIALSSGTRPIGSAQSTNLVVYI